MACLVPKLAVSSSGSKLVSILDHDPVLPIVSSPVILQLKCNIPRYSVSKLQLNSLFTLSSLTFFLEVEDSWKQFDDEATNQTSSVLSRAEQRAEAQSIQSVLGWRLESRLKLFLFSSIAEFAAIKIKSKSQNLHCCNVYNNIYIPQPL